MKNRCLKWLFLGVVTSYFWSCAAAPPVRVVLVPEEPKRVEISVSVVPAVRVLVPKDSRIVIGEIEGECAAEVKDALLRRLVENPEYSVLTRDNLDVILEEGDAGWEGRFNTETVARLGELEGASLFVFGRVSYCGLSASDSPDSEFGQQFNIVGVLQVVDSQTGQVVRAAASEGSYIPRPSKKIPDIEAPVKPSATPQPVAEEPRQKKLLGKLGEYIASSNAAYEANRRAEEERRRKIKGDAKPVPEPEDYQALRAAEHLASGFADKLFGRPTWERIEMWWSPKWKYGESVRYVRLGQCGSAVKLLEGQASQELTYMQDDDAARYLHNYGVALMCSGRPELGVEKLRAAYQIRNNKTTSRMMGFGGRMMEWGLNVQVGRDPIIKMLLGRLPLPM